MNYRLLLWIATLFGQHVLQTSGAIIAREAKGLQPNDGDIIDTDSGTSGNSIHDRSESTPSIIARDGDLSAYWAYQFSALQALDDKCGKNFDENIPTVGGVIEAPFQPHKRALNLETPGDYLWTATAAQCVVVGLQDADYVPFFGSSGANVIGTRGLCGCIALAIVSDAGAIVAHFAPERSLNLDPMFEKIGRKFMQMNGQHDVIAYLYHVNPGPDILESMANAGATMANSIRDRIVKDLRINVVQSTYDSNLSTYRWGTLVVAFNAQLNAISVWVNNRVRNR